MNLTVGKKYLGGEWPSRTAGMEGLRESWRNGEQGVKTQGGRQQWASVRASQESAEAKTNDWTLWLDFTEATVELDRCGGRLKVRGESSHRTHTAILA